MPLYVKNKNRKTVITSLIALAIGMTVSGWFDARPVFGQSAIPSIKQISLSASLFGSDNRIIPNGTYEVRFGIYGTDRATADAYPSNTDAGSRLWEETQTVTVKNGIFRAFLGSVTPLSDTLNFENGDYFIGMRIGTDSEMVPRKKLGSVPRAVNSQLLQGKTIGTNSGDIPVLGNKGKIDIKSLPTGTGSKQLVLGNDSRLHSAVTVSGAYDYLTLSGQDIVRGQIDLTTDVTGLLPAANGGTGINTSASTGVPIITAGTWSVATTLGVAQGGTGAATIGSSGSIAYSTGSAYGFSGVGTAGQALISGGSGIPTWTTLGGGSITADSLDFTELKDLLTLDASTDIAISGSNVFSLTNTGTGNSFLVNDAAGDTTPFVIDASGNVGIGDTTPLSLLTVGNGDLFQVNASGAIASATGVTSSGTITFSGLNTAGIVTNSAGGVLGTTSTVGVALGGTGTSTSFTQGSVVFAGASGAYAQDNANFFWDDTNNRLGLGYATPSARLDIAGTATTAAAGTEQITALADRDFSAAGNWSGTGWTVGSGVATHTAGANAFTLAAAGLDPDPVAAGIYQVTFTINTTTAGTLTPSIGGASGIAIGQAGGSTTQTQVITAITTGALTFTPDAAWIGTLDNISVVRVTPSNATQIVRNSDNTIGLEIRAGGTGLSNTFIGTDAGKVNTDGFENSFLGTYAGFSNTTGFYNSFIGSYVGSFNTTGSSNSFLGYAAGYVNTTGSANSFVGSYAGYSNTTGSANSFIGSYAGLSNTTGSQNSFLGYAAGYANTTGSYNSFFSSFAGYANTTGSQNSFLGYAAGYANTTGSQNSFLSSFAGYANTTGSQNSFLGDSAGYSNTTGSSNTALGYQAGYNGSVTLGTNTNSVFLGRDANTSVDGLTNVIALGYQAQATQSNQVILGNASITQTLLRGNIGIGDTTPAALFTVGSGDLFQVNSTGVIAAAAGITSSGSITFSGLSAGGVVSAASGTGILSVGTLGVTSGGTGATTLTQNGVLLGNGASAISATTGTSGQILVVSGANVPGFVTLSGDASISNAGVLSIGLGAVVGAQIANNTIEEVDLETTNAPTNGYILSFDSVTGGFTWALNTGGTGSSKFTDDGTYIHLTETTDDVVLGGTTIDAGFFFDISASTLAFEGATADTFETTLGVIDPTADRAINFPDVSGTVITTGNLTAITATGTIASGTWQGSVIAVANGGTGVSTLATNGVLIGNSTSPISSVNGTAGQLLIANASNTPTFLALSGDATLDAAGVLTLSSGAVTGAKIADNTIEEVDLEVTNVATDGYILSFSNATGGFTWVSSSSVGAGDITDVGSCTSGGCFIDGTNHTLTFDGSVIDAFETVLTVANPTADRTITLPDATGTVALLNGAQIFTSATWNGTVIGTTYGGTGVNGATAANGKVLIGNGSGYTLANMTQGTGITVTNGAGSITIASTLGTDISGTEIADNTIEEVDFEATNLPTNGYVLSYDSTTAGFTWISNTAGTGTSKWTDTGTLTYLTDIADDLAIGGTTGIASRFFFDVTTGNQIVFEGTGADDLNETTLVITNPTADRVITLPDATGTVALLNGAQTFTSATWNATGISVAYGGTGAATLTSKGVLFGNGTAAIGATAAGTNGQLLLGVTAGNPLFATLSGDASITAGGVLTLGTGVVTGVKIADNTIEEVDFEATNVPTNGYVLSYDSTTAGFTWISNTAGTGTSKWTDTGTLTYLTDIADDLAIGGTTGIASRFFFDVTTGNQIVFEGTGADDLNETTLIITNPTADRVITLPDATGTVLITGSTLLTLAGSTGSNQSIVQGDTITLAAGAGITTVGGATDTVTIASTLGVSVDLGTEVTGILPISSGGTGTTTFTSKGVLYGNGASAISATAAGTSGQLLLGVTAGNPGFATLSGDASITDTGVFTIASNAVLLTTDTVGNYVATITAGNGISGASVAEGGTPTLALGVLTSDWSQSGAFDISLNNASSELKMLESTGATFFGAFDVGDLSADQTYTFTTGGTVFTSGNDGSGSTLDADLLDGQDGSYYSNLANMTGVLAISKGGTNATTIGAAGTLPYSDGASYVFQSAAGSAGQALVSGGTTAPTWYAPTIGSILFAGISGALEQDNTNFFWNDTTNRLGLGTTTPGARLNVVDNIASDYAAEIFNDGNVATHWGMLVQSGLDDNTAAGPSTLIQFNDGDGGAVGSITFGSGVTAYNTTSDIRLKENISDTSLGIDNLMGIQVRDYEWKGDSENKITHGFIAQELNTIYPAAVTVPTDPARMWQVDYSKLTPLIVKAVQDQQGIIESQETKLTDLNLRTDQNITTLAGLQASVDTQLTVAGTELTALAAKDAEHDTYFANDMARLTALETLTGQMTLDMNTQASKTALLETQMQTLTAQLSTLTDFFTTFELGNLVMKDSFGNVDLTKDALGNPVLLGGRLKARILETGGLVIENVEIDAPTIGTTSVLPTAVDGDNDGNDDLSGKPMTDPEVVERDGTVVRVMTRAMVPMVKGSKIFTSWKGNPGAFSWIEKIRDDQGDYVGFKIRLSAPITEAVKVDWWLVAEK